MMVVEKLSYECDDKSFSSLASEAELTFVLYGFIIFFNSHHQ
jgi:hypothetical protein